MSYSDDVLTQYNRAVNPAAQLAGKAVAPITGLTNLSNLTGMIGAIPYVGDQAKASLVPYAEEADRQKNLAITGVAEAGIGMIGGSTLQTLDSLWKQAEAALVGLLRQLPGMGSDGTRLADTLLTSGDLTGGAQATNHLRQSLGTAYRATKTADMPSEEVISGAVAQGIVNATRSFGAVRKDIGSAVSDTFSGLLGKEQDSVTPESLAQDVGASVHVSVFNAAKQHYLQQAGIEKVTSKEALERIEREANRKAAAVADQVSGLSIESTNGIDRSYKIAGDADKPRGMYAYVLTQAERLERGEPASEAALSFGGTAPAGKPTEEKKPDVITSLPPEAGKAVDEAKAALAAAPSPGQTTASPPPVKRDKSIVQR